jgi:hypothetical protein
MYYYLCFRYSYQVKWQVYICHTPPGNINNAKTLSISVSDVADHLLNHSSDKLENVEKNHVRCFRGQGNS